MIHRSPIKKDFTVLPNAVLRDTSLSFKARGILAMMLSMPEDWQTHQTWIEKQGNEGREAIRSALQELEARGYLRREVIRKSGRVAGISWHWTDSPDDGKPPSGKPSCTKNSSEPKSKESKETGACFANPASSFSPEWRPDQRSKEQKLAAIPVPQGYPSEQEFDTFLEAEDLFNVIEYRSDAYQTLCRNKWHKWNERLGKWVKIRDWKAFTMALEETILEQLGQLGTK